MSHPVLDDEVELLDYESSRMHYAIRTIGLGPEIKVAEYKFTKYVLSTDILIAGHLGHSGDNFLIESSTASAVIWTRLPSMQLMYLPTAIAG